MKKNIIKIISFLVVFCIIFSLAQSVLHKRWASNADLYTRNIDYSSLPEGTVDVIAFGTSEMNAAYDPIVTFYEEGITGYNFSVTYRSAVPIYYQLLYALKYQTPKYVICDFSSLYDDQLPGEIEQIYRNVVECMPDKSIKNQLIKEICKLDSSQSYLSWKFPLLRYHSMWSTLSEENFTKDYVYDESYPAYAKGAMLNDKYIDEDSDMEIVPEIWDYSEDDYSFSEVSIYYYDMFIEECHSRGIDVIAVRTPSIHWAEKYSSRWKAEKEYFEERGVYYLDYCNYDQVKRMNLTVKDDFYDYAHLNVSGSIKFSKMLAIDLHNAFELEDHRGDENYYSEWEQPLSVFEEIYSLN